MADDKVKRTIISMIKAIDKAISLEYNAEKFYSRCALKTTSETGRAMFEWLSRFESSHLSRLKKKREELMGHSSITDPMPVPVYATLELSEADPNAEISPEISEIEVLKFAIDNERRAITFYEKKVTSSQDESVKALFKSMAHDEEKHIKILTDQLNHLQIEHIWGDIEALQKDIKNFK